MSTETLDERVQINVTESKCTEFLSGTGVPVHVLSDVLVLVHDQGNFQSRLCKSRNFGKDEYYAFLRSVRYRAVYVYVCVYIWRCVGCTVPYSANYA